MRVEGCWIVAVMRQIRGREGVVVGFRLARGRKNEGERRSGGLSGCSGREEKNEKKRRDGVVLASGEEKTQRELLGRWGLLCLGGELLCRRLKKKKNPKVGG